jgi:lipoate synthase
MTFDLIIANPPYGKIGAQITDTIREEVKYSHFVNLLPANDYKRVSNLHQYVRNMEAINNGFADAAVTTHLCEVVKDANEMTVDEFEISQYIDPQLDKYFRVLTSRTHYAIDNFRSDKDTSITPEKTIILGLRDVSSGHLPYSKQVDSYKWNVEKSITLDELIERHNSKRAKKAGVVEYGQQTITFNTEVEKTNLSNLMYSTTGFRFFGKLFTAVNVDSRFKLSKLFPKVDWTRAWTVEEILADYGYTAEEIAEVIADLKNFKGMED